MGKHSHITYYQVHAIIFIVILTLLFSLQPLWNIATSYVSTPAYAQTSSPDFHYKFSVDGVLRESTTPTQSTSPYLWLLSGGELSIKNGAGETIQGELPVHDSQRVQYAHSLSKTSDNGFHPQNTFQLLTKDDWTQNTTEVDVTITGTNLVNSDNVNPWNGIHLLSHYTDNDNHYTGSIRMDGYATIKKKQNGVYTTLSDAKIFPGAYDKFSNLNLLPENIPLQLRLEVTALSAQETEIKFYVNKGDGWKLATSALDKNPLPEGAHKKGVFSNFMNIKLDNFIVRDTGSSATVNTQSTVPTTSTSASFYGLNSNTTVTETGSLTNSNNAWWWVNSGAYLHITNGVASTNQGNLPKGDTWRTAYDAANPLDTEDGQKPQNIFRLVTTKTFKNVQQQGYFKINDYNTTNSPNRAGHNGILFMSRYKDGQTLYYAGLRVDGNLIVKKKHNGTYYTLESKKVLSGTYDRNSNPNLIPENIWIGIKTEVEEKSDGTHIRVYVDKNNDGVWKLESDIVDSGNQGGSIVGTYNAGIRTDFMDVEFKNYSVKEM